MSDSKRIGDPCPTCGRPLARAAAQFYWRGHHYDGAVCDNHGPAHLYAIEGEEMPPLRPLVLNDNEAS